MEPQSEALNWLYSLEARGEIYKLERMERALALIGNPHRRLRAVHIAGTKGKGSVAAMIESCLRAAGLRCGLYTKPHLVRLTERTRVAGREMALETMLGYIRRLRSVYERAGLGLTFFEFTVALMFLYFAEVEVDLAVVETGLGGRLDSTNVLAPLLSVITPIGFDHTDRLGHTLSAIAREKGGIIKPATPVVIGARASEAVEVLTAIAAQRRSPSRIIGRDFAWLAGPGRLLDYHGWELRLTGLTLGLAGGFQRENAAIALAALEMLQELGVPLKEAHLRAGLANVQWPGRFDTVSRRPLVILDCAHNELGLKALLEAIDADYGAALQPRLLFACLADKPWERMAAMLAARVQDATLTRVPQKRPLEPEALASAFAGQVPTRIERDPRAAIARLVAETPADQSILVTGSVYLVGAVYPYFLERQGRAALFPEAEG